MRRDPFRAAASLAAILAAFVFIVAVAALRPAAEARDPGPRGGKADPPPVTRYAGNTESYKFHRMACKYAGCANCTAKFETREDAIKAGYKPGGCCDP